MLIHFFEGCVIEWEFRILMPCDSALMGLLQQIKRKEKEDVGSCWY